MKSNFSFLDADFPVLSQFGKTQMHICTLPQLLTDEP